MIRRPRFEVTSTDDLEFALIRSNGDECAFHILIPIEAAADLGRALLKFDRSLDAVPKHRELSGSVLMRATGMH